jgi:hypothetical protein
LRYWDRRGRAHSWRHGAGVVCAVVCLVLLGGMALAQTTVAPPDSAPGPAQPPSPSLDSWGGLFLRYLLLTILCAGAFTLVFLKCWRDASAAANPKPELGPAPESAPAETEKPRRKANA